MKQQARFVGGCNKIKQLSVFILRGDKKKEQLHLLTIFVVHIYFNNIFCPNASWITCKHELWNKIFVCYSKWVITNFCNFELTTSCLVHNPQNTNGSKWMYQIKFKCIYLQYCSFKCLNVCLCIFYTFNMLMYIYECCVRL